jgi:hypothetical protein
MDTQQLLVPGLARVEELDPLVEPSGVEEVPRARDALGVVHEDVVLD